MNRRFLGGFLLLATPLAVMFVGLAVVLHAPWWSAFFILPVVFGCGCGIWQFLADPVVVLIRDGCLEVRWPRFRAGIRIPLPHLRAARIREPGMMEGRGYFLEISLDCVTPGLEPWLNTLTKRVTVKDARKYGGYEPPPEPFLILSIPRLKVTDGELSAMIERERMVEAAMATRLLDGAELA